MKISVVIPTLRIGEKLQKAIDSFKGEYDEFIIVDDNWDNLGKKINKGLEQASGDYVIVSNDDVELSHGHLWNLCHEEKVSAPLIDGRMMKAFHAHMECFPRWILDLGIKWPEDYDGFYYDDSDVWMQLLKHEIRPSIDIDVDIKHNHPGWTLGTFNNSSREKINREIFIKKWGFDSLKLVGC